MTKDAILFGGTDPGRFCPTYIIFCESFTPHRCQPAQDQNFDRRDVYIITQNALADGTYLCYLRAQYNRSEQIDPPFFRELIRTVFKDKEYQTNLLARAVAPLDRFFCGWATEWRSAGAPIPHGSRIRTLLICRLHRQTASRSATGPPLQVPLRESQPGHPGTAFGTGNEGRLRRSLAEDLNRLLERELKISNGSRPGSKTRRRWIKRLPTATNPSVCARSKSGWPPK